MGQVVSQFRSRAELFSVLRASCHIPIAGGLLPYPIKDHGWFWDGLLWSTPHRIQGYLAHKKQRLSRTLSRAPPAFLGLLPYPIKDHGWFWDGLLWSYPPPAFSVTRVSAQSRVLRIPELGTF